MKQVGTILPVARAKPGTGGPPAHAGKRPGAWFAETKEAWAIQVASDRDLPETALRIALVLPKWLNAKTLKAWPAQSTIAALINTSDRAVRGGLKRLVEAGHLVCLTETPGGRKSNVYRIVVNDGVIDEPGAATADTAEAIPGTRLPDSPEHTFRSERNELSGQRGSGDPVSAAPAFRGTLERTPERTDAPVRTSDDAGADTEPTHEPRMSPERARAIMAELYGQGQVSETGYLQRKR